MKLYTSAKSYTAKHWDLSALTGISDETLEMHFGLYEGYVKNTNLLEERLHEMMLSGKASGSDPSFAELVRRASFEFNGMRLHELYFDNMTRRPAALREGPLLKTMRECYGSLEDWKKDFSAVGQMRGVGWAIAYYDPGRALIVNRWTTEHENGNFAGCNPIVVMDVWEHAWIKDFKPAEREKYVEAFFANLDWTVCESRIPAIKG